MLMLLPYSTDSDTIPHDDSLVASIRFGVLASFGALYVTYIHCVPKKTVVPKFGDNFVKS